MYVIVLGRFRSKIENSTILTQFFRIQIVKKSIFEKFKKSKSNIIHNDYESPLKGLNVAIFLN